MKYFVILVFTFLVSCQGEVKIKDVTKLNGYWEIEKVELPDGSSKQYKINESIDYFKINDSLKGFRKKVILQLDGNLSTNDVKENVEVITANDLLFLDYLTDYAQWKEEVLELSNDKLVLKNENGISYFYKRKQVGNE